VKQNPLPAKSNPSLIAFVVVVFAYFALACAILPRHTSSEVQLNLAQSKVQRASLINLNSASAQELEKLPGVGQVIAERILAHRQQYGPFRRVEHLLMVRGISDRKFRVIQNSIFVE
jgi:competence ComEA-like helix-hairpin-helix protein